MCPDLLALRIVLFVKKVHLEDELLHLWRPFHKKKQRRPFFLHLWNSFCHRLQDTKCANQAV